MLHLFKSKTSASLSHTNAFMYLHSWLLLQK